MRRRSAALKVYIGKTKDRCLRPIQASRDGLRIISILEYQRGGGRVIYAFGEPFTSRHGARMVGSRGDAIGRAMLQPLYAGQKRDHMMHQPAAFGNAQTPICWGGRCSLLMKASMQGLVFHLTSSSQASGLRGSIAGRWQFRDSWGTKV